MEGPVLTATIAASVTVFTLLVGKWIDSNHKRTDLLRGKLEELFRALDALLQNSNVPDLPNFEENMSRERRKLALRIQWSKQQQLLASSILECSMMAALYFPTLADQFSKLVGKANERSDLMCKEVTSPESGTHSSEDGYTFDGVMDEVISLKVSIISNQARLTRKFPRWFGRY